MYKRSVFLFILIVNSITGYSQYQYEYQAVEHEVVPDGKTSPRLKYTIHPEPLVNEELVSKTEKLPDGEVRITLSKSGNIMGKAFFRNGVMHGIRQLFNADGSLQQEVPYVQGNISGVVKYFTDGQVSIETHYRDNKREGNRTFYFPSGEVQFVIPYQADRINGITWEYVRKGGYRLNRKASFKNGVLDGPLQLFEEDLMLKHIPVTGRESTVYVSKVEQYKAGVKVSPEVTYNPDGSMKSKTMYTKGIPVRTELYDAQGKLIYTNKFREGKEHGLHRVYYPGGQLMAETEYKDGSKDGKLVTYFENGQVERIQYFQNDDYKGVKRVYFENGHVQKEVFYQSRSTKEGTEKEYYPNGGIKTEITYDVAGHMTKEESYYDTGVKSSIILYESNRFLEVTYFARNGELLTVNQYKAGKAFGLHKYFMNDVLYSLQYFDEDQNGFKAQVDNKGRVVRREYYLKNKKVSEDLFNSYFRIEADKIFRK